MEEELEKLGFGPLILGSHKEACDSQNVDGGEQEEYFLRNETANPALKDVKKSEFLFHM